MEGGEPMIYHAESVARGKLGHPADFKFFRYESVTGGLLLTGCVTTQVYSSGPRKGRPKYEGDKAVVVVTPLELSAEQIRYSAETGNCAECIGEAKVFQSWDHVTGTTYRPCRTCNGTGKVSR